MYDLVIIGGGPAGLTAALYACRARLKTLIVEKASVGGQVLNCDILENYPGVGDISGPQLIEKFKTQISRYEPEIICSKVEKVISEKDLKKVVLPEETIHTRSVIIASGAVPKALGVPGEQEFVGRGVSYCATCDGPLFAGQDIVVVGGGDTAVKEAIFLSKIVNKVYLLHRRDNLRAEKIYQDKLLDIPNIQVLWSAVLSKIEGDQSIERVVVKDLKTQLDTTIDVQGVFIFVGIDPAVNFVDCEKDEQGFVLAGEDMQSSIDGVFIAGDCRRKPLRQVTTAVADGAQAAVSVENYLESLS